MRARILAALTFVFLLYSMSAAQGYSIRANRGLNLRAAPSLNADVAGTVRSGANLEVVGESGRWLQIEWPGNDVWLANWVNFSRVEESVQTSSQTGKSTNIDNCCFVDRQCMTDQEWTDGYWAFQNNECAAPAQTPATNYGIIIEGSETFIAQISAALDLLRNRAPQWHAYVVKGPSKIGESEPGSPDGFAAGDAFYISSSAAAKPAHILAQLMVHEACHVQRTPAGLLRYETEQQQNLEESLAGYVSSVAGQQIRYGRVIMSFTPAQVARLLRDGKLEQRTPSGRWSVTYITREAGQLLREGIDVLGAVRAEIARANSLLR